MPLEPSNRIDLHLARMPISNLYIGMSACDVNHMYTKCLQKYLRSKEKRPPEFRTFGFQNNIKSIFKSNQIHMPQARHTHRHSESAYSTTCCYQHLHLPLDWSLWLSLGFPSAKTPGGWDTEWSASDPFQQWPGPDSLPHRDVHASLVSCREDMLTLEDIVMILSLHKCHYSKDPMWAKR